MLNDSSPAPGHKPPSLLLQPHFRSSTPTTIRIRSIPSAWSHDQMKFIIPMYLTKRLMIDGKRIRKPDRC
jgi:hypothetical protein